MWRKDLLPSLLCAFIATGCGSRPLPPVTEKSTAEAPVEVLVRSLKGPYRVRRGDTLYSIAFEAGADYRDLAVWNGIEPPYRLREGQILKLSPPKAATGKTVPPAASPRTPTTPASVEAAIKWSWPAEGPVLQGFGGAQTNRGLEIGGRDGQPVRAAAGGRVVYAGSGLRGYGELIIVKHDETYLSAYAHNRRLLAQEGQMVSPGQTIAEMGDTGASRVKLHFEIRQRGVPVDPMAYLPRR